MFRSVEFFADNPQDRRINLRELAKLVHIVWWRSELLVDRKLSRSANTINKSIGSTCVGRNLGKARRLVVVLRSRRGSKVAVRSFE